MLNEEQVKQLTEKIGADATNKINADMQAAEKRIKEAAIDAQKGFISAEAFEDYKKKQTEAFDARVDGLNTIIKDQGTKLGELIEKGKQAAPNSVSFEDWLVSQKDAINTARKSGGYYEVTGEQLKAAGISSITGTVSNTVVGVPANPYAPGPAGGPLTIFGLRNNPNFITSRVDMGRTNSAVLTWANELTEEGSPALVAEGAAKPLISSTYNLEVSTPKKIAAYSVITEEFEQDLPGFATEVRRKIQERVVRYFDDRVQVGVYSKAQPYNITSLNTQIYDANLYDAILAMEAQIGFYNYTANTIAMNAIEEAKVLAGKGTDGHYLNPPFMNRFNGQMVMANKMAIGFALVGDLTQYKVDVYKDFVLKIGWINDDLIKNQFCIVGEMRYHDYISTARTKALCYNNLQYVATQINGTPHS